MIMINMMIFINMIGGMTNMMIMIKSTFLEMTLWITARPSLTINSHLINNKDDLKRMLMVALIRIYDVRN